MAYGTPRDRECISCGATFTGRYQKCDQCRRPPKPCVVPGCANPKAPGQGSKSCQEHRDNAYQRKLESLHRTVCFMPGCDEPKLVAYSPTGRRRPYRYCARHSAEALAREREQTTRRRRERELGITHDQFLAMLAAQGGMCAICGNGNGNSRQLSVDHDHATGVVRALLCDRCNPMLGYARDSIPVLRAAITYLERHSQNGLNGTAKGRIVLPDSSGCVPRAFKINAICDGTIN